MPRDWLYLIDIVEAAKLAVSYLQGKTKADFLADTQCQDAVLRRLEIIGEAARRISSGAREQLPQLPWQAMVGMRNVVIHEYDSVDLSIVWETVRQDLPQLIVVIEKLLARGSS